MALNKTLETNDDVYAFLNTVKDETKRNDCIEITKLMEKQTGFKAKMWGTAIVGFGSYHYKYESGREGDMCLTGFSPRANAITFYFSYDFEGRAELLAQLGKHTTSKACVYVKKLADIDKAVLKKIITHSVKNIRAKYPD